jgi:DNA-binding FadR family transcriptional regulator
LGQTVTVALDITLRLSLDAPKGQQQSLPFHKTVLEAITGRDAPAAAAAMLALVDASERDVAEARAAQKQPRRDKPIRPKGPRKP